MLGLSIIVISKLVHTYQPFDSFRPPHPSIIVFVVLREGDWYLSNHTLNT